MENMSVPALANPEVVFKKAIGAFDPSAHPKAGEEQNSTGHCVSRGRCSEKGSVPQKDTKQRTLSNAIKTIADVM